MFFWSLGFTASWLMAGMYLWQRVAAGLELCGGIALRGRPAERWSSIIPVGALKWAHEPSRANEKGEGDF